jgi:MFS family permease
VAGAAPPDQKSMRSPLALGLMAGFMTATSGLGLSAPPVVLGDLAGDLGLQVRDTAWVLSGYLLAVAVSTPLLGRIADVRGIRPMLRLGALLVVAGGALSVVAPTFVALIAARVVEAAGAAAMSLGGFMLVATCLQGTERAVGLGLLTAESSIALGAGPLIGALVGSALSWRAVVALPALSILALPRVLAALPGGVRREGAIDVRGAVLVLAAAGAALALLQARANHLGATVVAALAVGGVGTGIAALVHTRGRPGGFLPHAVVTNRPFVLLAVTAGALFAGYLGMLFMAPLLILANHGWNPVHLGAVMAPGALAAVAASRLTGRLAARLRTHVLLAAVAGLGAVGILLAAVAHAEPAAVVLGLSLAICGFAVAQVAVIDRIPELVPSLTQGVAIGVFNLVFVTGGAVGAALAGGLADAVSLPLATALIVAAPLLALVLALVIDRSREASQPTARPPAAAAVPPA